MKLGLIIKLTSGGEQESFAVNKQEEWAKFATDSRSIINDLNGFDGSGKSAIIVKFLSNLGYLLGVVKARPEGSGRPNDNTTAWIHVPAKMQITEQELCSVINYIDEQLSAALGINPAILEELFSKEYSEKNVQFSALAFIGNNPDGCIGWRDYGVGTGYALHELLGNSLAQTFYKKYKCICFVDKALNLSTVGGEIIKSEPKVPIMIKAPIDNSGFIAFIKTKNQEIPFRNAIEIPANTSLSVIWKKEGYFDIEKELKGNNLSSLVIQENERKLIFKRSWIRVTNQRFKHLTNADISVNGKAFSSEITEITEAALREGVKIRVSYQGYEPKEKVISQLSSNIEIMLEDKQECREYKLRVEDGKNLESDATIIVKMNNRYTGMPLKGYRSDHNGHIEYENNLMTKIKWFAIGVASVFVFGLLWTGFEALDSWVDNHNFQFAWPPITKIEKVVASTQESESASTFSSVNTNKGAQPNTGEDSKDELMCNYLSTNDVWHKDSLEQYNLAELFANMNTFNLKELIKLEETELIEIDKIKKIVEASKKSIEERIPLSGKYNSDTDSKITIDKFINKITTKVSSRPNQPKAPSKITGRKTSDQKNNSTNQQKSQRGTQE